VTTVLQESVLTTVESSPDCTLTWVVAYVPTLSSDGIKTLSVALSE